MNIAGHVFVSMPVGETLFYVTRGIKFTQKSSYSYDLYLYKLYSIKVILIYIAIDSLRVSADRASLMSKIQQCPLMNIPVRHFIKQ